MVEKSQIYKCEMCGNIVEVLKVGGGELVCCGAPMVLQNEKVEEAGFTEKHLPILEQTDKGIRVKIGQIQHPMDEAHYIEWIEVETEQNKILRKFLNPGELPEVEFLTHEKLIKARTYCNLHNLWSVNLKF